MIEIRVNGVPYTQFIEARVTLTLNTLSNQFSFTASAVGDFPSLTIGSLVTITVERIKVLTGYIERADGNDSEGQHTITYVGRDKTGDLVDSSFNALDEIKPSNSLTLKRLVELSLNHIGLDLNVIDLVNAAPFNQAEDVVTPLVGASVFEFLSDFAKKRQVLLTSNADGDIVLTQSQPTSAGATVQRLQGANDNNIISQNWTIAFEERFNKYVHRGQVKPKAMNFTGDILAEPIANQNGVAIDSDIRTGRQQVNVETKSYSDAQLKNRAAWSKQLAIARATSFNCVVQGHTKPNGGLWAVNELVQVNSDVADISRKMLLESITFSDGEGAPTISELSFVEQNVYTLDEKLQSQRQAGSVFDAFKSLG